MPQHAKPLPTVIVLAAGRGERFIASGGSTHKLAALLNGKTVLEHTLDAVRASGLPFELVLPASDASLGMGNSIARGVAQAANLARTAQEVQRCGYLVLPADLPCILPATLLAVAQALHAGTAQVVQPFYRGQAAHPVGFSWGCKAQLLALLGASADLGARSVVQHYAALGQCMRVEVDDAGAVQDVDTLGDLLALQF